MKQDVKVTANVSLEKKRSVEIEFIRFGKKGKPNTIEAFWLGRPGAYTLNDLKTLVKEAEKLIRIADGEDATNL